MNAIETQSLRKVFPNDVVAVAGIDLAVAEGTIVGFLGPNGAGKSTTVRMLTTLMKPTSGSARVLGLDVATHAHRIRTMIGAALQEAGLDNISNGRELLVLQARLHGMNGTEASRRAADVLDLVGLTEAADRRIGTYSGGMRRRLDLASALIHGPRLLFLDEPTSGLDPASRQAIWDEVHRLNTERGMTVFLTTQYLEEADRLADRVAIIDHGRIVAEGTPEELKGSIGTDIVTIEVPGADVERAQKALGTLEGLREMRTDDTGLTLFISDGSSAVARAVRALDKAKVRVGSVALSSPTLDEVFLRATGSRLEGAHADGSSREAT